MNTPKQPKKKMKVWCKVLLIIVTVLLLLIIAAAITINAIISHYYNMMSYTPIEDDTEIILPPDDPDYTEKEDDNGYVWVDPNNPDVTTSPPPELTPEEQGKLEDDIKDNVDDDYVIDFEDDVTNILLIGSDSRNLTSRGRSDTMIILTINKTTKQLVLTSLMRDIYLHIPTVDRYNRINAAYSWGGVSMLLDTIEENFKLHIDKYVRINFTGFTNVINGIGGIDVELSQKEIDYLKIQDTAKPGVVHLDGALALKYARCRYVSKSGQGSDFARTLRQREVLTIVFNKVKNMNFSTLDALLKEFLPQVATNLTQSEITGILFNAPSYAKYEVKSYRMPVNGAWNYARINGMSVLSVNFEKCIAALEKYINGEGDTSKSSEAAALAKDNYLKLTSAIWQPSDILKKNKKIIPV